MTTESYNGWANRETWAVSLHINNDQGWQESVHEALREARTSAQDLGGVLHDYQAGKIIGENVVEALRGMVDRARYMNSMCNAQRTLLESYVDIRDDIGSLWRVDWTELGASFLATLADVDAL